MRTKGRQADRPMDLTQVPLSSVKPLGCSLCGLCLSQMSDEYHSHQTSSQQTHRCPNIPWQIFAVFYLLTSIPHFFFFCTLFLPILKNSIPKTFLIIIILMTHEKFHFLFSKINYVILCHFKYNSF